MKWISKMGNLGYDFAISEKRLTKDEIKSKYGKDFLYKMTRGKYLKETKNGKHLEPTKKFMKEFSKNERKVEFHNQGSKHAEASKNFGNMLDKKTLKTIQTETAIKTDHSNLKRRVAYKSNVDVEKKRVREALIKAQDQLKKDVAGKTRAEQKKLEQKYHEMNRELEANYKVLFNVSTVENPRDPNTEIQKPFADQKPIASSPDLKFTFTHRRLEMLVEKMEEKISRFEHSRGRGNKDDLYKKLYEESRDKLKIEMSKLPVGGTVDIDVEIITGSYSEEDKQRHRNYERFTGKTLIMIPEK